MCGILGVLGCRSSGQTTATIERALSRLKHRGPDDEGYLLFNSSAGSATAAGGRDTDGGIQLPRFCDFAVSQFDAVLGHRRLSILDVSPAGHQPMRSPDGRYWIVLNGEIYNFVELRTELSRSGFSFRTGTDTEVLLAAFTAWGAAMLPRLIGMFALAILDTVDGVVFLARDPLGIKPLYWSRSRRGFAFASEITPLLDLEIAPAAADAGALYQYLRFGVTDAHSGTMFAGVNQLEPGHHMSVGLDGVPVNGPIAYWEPSRVRPRDVSMADAASELGKLFSESIRLHLRSDVPLGACLSGGLDSTAIVANMRQQLGSHAPIHAFSFLADDAAINEGPFIKIAVAQYQLRSHVVSPTPAEFASDMDALIRSQEQPFDSTSIYAQYRVFRLAHETGITVMLDGQGSDELFGGYATAVSAQLAAAVLHGNLAAAFSLARSPHMRGAATRARLLMAAGARLLPSVLVPALMSVVGEPLYPSWINSGWFHRRGHHAHPRVQGRGRGALREELLHYIRTLSLPRLLRYEDRNSMRFSIESRVPFCTVPLADFALSLPPSLLVGWNGETKSVLRRAVESYLPLAILNRPKIGFATPESAWLQTLRPWVKALVADDHFRSLPFLAHPAAGTAVSRQVDGLAPVTATTWRLLNVARWAQAFDVRFDQ